LLSIIIDHLCNSVTVQLLKIIVIIHCVVASVITIICFLLCLIVIQLFGYSAASVE